MRRINEIRLAMHGSPEEVGRFFDRAEFEIAQLVGDTKRDPEETRAAWAALKGDLNGI